MIEGALLARVRGPEGNLGYLFRLAHQGFRSGLEAALAPCGLSVPQYGALSVFDSAPELSSAELARLADVTPQTMNTLVHHLVERGLLNRRPHPTHGKVVVLHLSRGGRRLLDKATPRVRAVEYAALGSLNEHETRIVTAWLSEVAALFS